MSAPMPSPAQVIAHVFTSPNPATGSQPPPEMAWAVFAHGTVFFTAPSAELPATASLEAIAGAARAALRELGPVVPGSPAADFHPSRLDGWYPEEPVWFVGFDHANLATIVTLGESELAAGLAARSRRQRDHDDPRLVLVRGFSGAVEVVEAAEAASDPSSDPPNA